jgi:hypothetical protein
VISLLSPATDAPVRRHNAVNLTPEHRLYLRLVLSNGAGL